MAGEATERRPLLNNAEASPNPSTPLTKHRIVYTAIIGLLVNTACVTATAFSNGAMDQLVEGAVCQRLYPDVTDRYHDTRCKNDDVQSQLSLVNGWQTTFGIVPGLLVAVPYGFFADKYGPRALLPLTFLGTTTTQFVQQLMLLNPQVFDARWVWAANILTFIGGGTVAWEAMKYAVANSLASQGNRATIFLYVGALTTLNQLAVSPLVYLAMEKSPVLSAFIGTGSLAVGGLLSFALPKNMGTQNAKENPESPVVPGTHWALRPLAVFRTAISAMKTLLQKNVHLGFLLISLILTTIGHLESSFDLQYATKRYGWTWSKAGLIQSLTSTMSLIVMVVAVPFATFLLLKWNTPTGKDIWISRIGILSLVTGSFGMGLAPTSAMFITALSVWRVETCYTPAVMSLIAHVAGIDDVQKDQTGLVYLCMSFMRCTGIIIGGPLLAEALRLGLRYGGGWLGLPFLAAGCLQFIAAIIVFSVREKRTSHPPEQ